jgi:threonine synthase
MDIQVSSNLERLLFELYGRDGAVIADLMQAFRAEGRATVDPDRLAVLTETFSADSVDDDITVDVIRSTYERTGVLIDPHTAVGVAVAERTPRDPDVPMVCLATAHPAKFPDAVERATGVRPELPARLADVLTRSERFTTLPNDLAAVRAHLLAETSS